MAPDNSFDDKSSNAVVAEKLGALPPPDLPTNDSAAHSIPINENMYAHIRPYEEVAEFHLHFSEEGSEQELTPVTGIVSSDA